MRSTHQRHQKRWDPSSPIFLPTIAASDQPRSQAFLTLGGPLSGTQFHSHGPAFLLLASGKKRAVAERRTRGWGCGGRQMELDDLDLVEAGGGT